MDDELLTNIAFDKFKYAPSTQNGYDTNFQNFQNNEELIFAGCSQTNGEHISLPMVENGDCTKIWGFQVANHFKMSSINLGLAGESIYTIVQKLFAHFNNYGNPKVLLCLFPDPYRLTLPRDNEVLISKNTNKDTIIETSYSDNHRPGFSKRPHYKEEVIPDVVPVWLNMQSIIMLQQYCNSSKIKFLYGSWSEETDSLIQNSNLTKKTYTNFLDLNSRSWSKEELNCHLDLKNKYNNIFDFGIDGKHMGVHRHTHIAELFIKELSKHEQ